MKLNKRNKSFAPLRAVTRVVASAFIATTVSAAAFAQQPAKAKAKAEFDGTLPVVLENLKRTGGLTVHGTFDAVGGLTGWVIRETSSGKYGALYTTADGEVLISGLILDKNGTNLAKIYSDKHIPQPDMSLAYEDFAKNSNAVVLGSADAPAEIVVAFDANCTYCKLLHKLVHPAIEAGELRMRVVPVDILGGDSGIKGAGLLAASDLKAALQATTYGLGQIQRSSDPAVLSKVRANTDLMRKHGFNGTPLVLYQAGSGDEPTLMVSNGVPNIREMFERLGISGQLGSLKDDPALARYIQ